MVFSSLVFIFVFLPITILIYYIAPKALRNLVFLIASLIFYAWGEPIYILIMLFSTIFDYANGLAIDKYRGRKNLSKVILINSLIVNLGILGFFKYSHFIVNNINSFFNLNMTLRNLPFH